MGVRQGKSQVPSSGNRTVFISYRRAVSWATARLVFNDLVRHDFDVFMDVESIDGGHFERIVLAQIAARVHFVVLLEPGSLDRIAEEGDWLRREISHAITHGRNVVPVTASGFQMRADLTLPQDIAQLTSFNTVSVPHDYFDEAMRKLRERFLRPQAPQLAQPKPATTDAVNGRIRKATATAVSTPDRPHVTPPARPNRWNRLLKSTALGLTLILLAVIIDAAVATDRAFPRQVLARNGPQVTQESSSAATESIAGNVVSSSVPPPAPAPPVPPPTSVPIRVYNNSTIEGLAARAAGDFRRGGWQVVETGNYPAGVIPASTVYFRPGTAEEVAAQVLGNRFDLRIEPRFPGLESAAPGLIVIVRNDYGGK